MNDETLDQDQQAAPLDADFARIAADADALAREMAGEAPPPGAEPAAAPSSSEPTNAEVIADVLRSVRGLPFVIQRFPRAAATMPDEVCLEVGDAAGALMDKYGWTFGGLGGWKVELRALMVVGGFAYGLGVAVNADIDAMRATQARDVSPGSPGAAPPAGEGEGEAEPMTIKFG